MPRPDHVPPQLPAPPAVPADRSYAELLLAVLALLTFGVLMVVGGPGAGPHGGARVRGTAEGDGGYPRLLPDHRAGRHGGRIEVNDARAGLAWRAVASRESRGYGAGEAVRHRRGSGRSSGPWSSDGSDGSDSPGGSGGSGGSDGSSTLSRSAPADGPTADVTSGLPAAPDDSSDRADVTTRDSTGPLGDLAGHVGDALSTLGPG